MFSSLFTRALPRRSRLVSTMVLGAVIVGCIGTAGCGKILVTQTFRNRGASDAEPCELADYVSRSGCEDPDRQLGITEGSVLPKAVGNAYADDTAAALLGMAIFYDARFSSNLEVRCATCHMPETAFTEHQPVSHTLARVPRNAPSLLNAARNEWQFWDGRADSLWSQPIFSMENPAEMDFTRLELAQRIQRSYQQQYEAVFGPLPADLDDAGRFPARGKPGDASFDGMDEDDQAAINGLAANVGKAIAAYMRKAASGPGRFDDYLQGDEDALTEQERDGFEVFVAAGCDTCHSGTQLSDGGFHNLGTPAWPEDAPAEGRAAAVAVLEANVHNSAGPFHDADSDSAGGYGSGDPTDRVAYARDALDADPEGMLGAIRTPSLRNVGMTAPYGHNGRFATLEQVVDFHLQGGGRPDENFLGDIDPLLQPVELSDDERTALVAFLRALDGSYPPPPWDNWPDK